MRNALRAVLIPLVLAGCATGQKVTDLSKGETGWLSYPSSVEKISLSGHLALPENAQGRVPAMIIAHASGGTDARDERWARFLTGNGIAAFRIDYFGPRGITAHSRFQPVPHHDAADALRLLSTHPRIDPKRIGIIGFSRGANIAVHAANTEGFAAHVGLYPSCMAVSVNRGGSKAPVLILVGGLDDLVPVSSCDFMVRQARQDKRQVELKVYEKAHHGWDGDFSGVFHHRAINKSYRLQPDRQVTEQSRADVLEFLKTVFGM